MIKEEVSFTQEDEAYTPKKTFEIPEKSEKEYRQELRRNAYIAVVTTIVFRLISDWLLWKLQ